MKSFSGLAIFIALLVAEIVSLPFLLEFEDGYVNRVRGCGSWNR